METVILAVVLLVAIYAATLSTIAYRRVAKHLLNWGNLGESTVHNLSVIFGKVESMESTLEDVRDVLTEASRLKAAKSEVFDSRDKIPAKAPAHYVPIARRRAQAEIASMGPVTHDAKVRENNAKAMESA